LGFARPGRANDDQYGDDVTRRSAERVVKFDPGALRTIRGTRELTLDALAARVGAARSTLIGYEKGRLVPGIDSLAALAAALDVDPLDLTSATLETATVADLRVRRGLSKAALAAELGVSPASWDAIERGRRPLRDDLATRAARLLRVDLAELAAAQRRGLEERLRTRPEDRDPGWQRTVVQLTRDASPTS
jgi:transcriptional regulator with XRE-family HTH domain